MKEGNHRSFSGPVLPLYAQPNRFTRTAAVRIVFVVPSAEGTGPATGEAQGRARGGWRMR